VVFFFVCFYTLRKINYRFIGSALEKFAKVAGIINQTVLRRN